ncbi:L28 family ribosomal protein [Candidatus Carsonella ruddii]|uniref:Ribosomal protein L28 n=1 Tax=Candidatus Carsonella ruddii PC isolate NHV TaxID=1202540 RepID=J3Z259_CARRU|nr:L28 family ribosomal protein [Candidatus Carsonella ruddii]AFP84344.1 ribosomal protein L28 [Candidatus Carsonella ruddii PC isolate NHV]
MSKICLFTKKKTLVKNSVSNSNIKNKKKTKINFKNISIWVKNEFVKLKISTKSIKIIKKCIF